MIEIAAYHLQNTASWFEFKNTLNKNACILINRLHWRKHICKFSRKVYSKRLWTLLQSSGFFFLLIFLIPGLHNKQMIMNPIWASSLATTHFSQIISIKDFNWRCSFPNLYFRKIILKTAYRIDYELDILQRQNNGKYPTPCHLLLHTV